MNNNLSKLRCAVFCLEHATFIRRYHRNVSVLKEMGFQVRSISVKCRQWTHVKPFEGVLVDGWTCKFRGRFFGPLRHLEIAVKFFWEILKFKPDILFAHNLPALFIGWIVACLRGRKKTVLIYDAMELESARTPTLRPYIPFLSRNFQMVISERFLVKRADIVISADYNRTEAMHRLLPISGILTCRNVPKLTEVKRMRLFHDSLGLRDDAFIFLYQGAVLYGRGIEQGIRSIKDLPEQIVFVIVGMCVESYSKALRELAESIGVGDRVFILRPVPSDELLKYTASADVIHSLIENVCLSYYLAAPNKLYEAAMAGVPVIASCFPEMEAVLTRYPYGLLVNPESAKEISDALLFLYENESVREEFKKVAIEASRTELNWEMESQKLRKRIISLVEKKCYNN